MKMQTCRAVGPVVAGRAPPGPAGRPEKNLWNISRSLSMRLHPCRAGRGAPGRTPCPPGKAWKKC